MNDPHVPAHAWNPWWKGRAWPSGQTAVRFAGTAMTWSARWTVMARQIAGCEPGQESERLPPTGTYTHPPHTLPTGYAQDELI